LWNSFNFTLLNNFNLWLLRCRLCFSLLSWLNNDLNFNLRGSNSSIIALHWNSLSFLRALDWHGCNCGILFVWSHLRLLNKRCWVAHLLCERGLNQRDNLLNRLLLDGWSCLGRLCLWHLLISNGRWFLCLFSSFSHNVLTLLQSFMSSLLTLWSGNWCFML
jgi:hypothetical protein